MAEDLSYQEKKVSMDISKDFGMSKSVNNW